MSYQVLARKWRPKQFSELVGQEHVVSVLTNALTQQRIHHAYLFTGTRGVGKTTIARIFAKSLNCEQGISATPCGKCDACVDIDAGRYVDLLEIDAASRTKVDDTREILDNVQYAPSRGKFKVYLIDEVHMLSRSSFNALLKTLEEPPEHVKFILATTDPQKLPVTVLSRCLQFHLKALSIKQIESKLVEILAAEKVDSEQGCLTTLAKAARGSMRDSLSLTDQAIAQGQGNITLSHLQQMLGGVDQNWVFKILVLIAKHDSTALMTFAQHIAEYAPNYHRLLAQLIQLLHQIAMIQVVDISVDLTPEHHEIAKKLALSLSAEDVQLYYQLVVNGRKDMPYAIDEQAAFEMVLLRMLAFKPMSQAQVASEAASTAENNSAQALLEDVSFAETQIEQPAARVEQPAELAPLQQVSAKETPQQDLAKGNAGKDDVEKENVQAAILAKEVEQIEQQAAEQMGNAFQQGEAQVEPSHQTSQNGQIEAISEEAVAKATDTESTPQQALGPFSEPPVAEEAIASSDAMPTVQEKAAVPVEAEQSVQETTEINPAIPSNVHAAIASRNMLRSRKQKLESQAKKSSDADKRQQEAPATQAAKQRADVPDVETLPEQPFEHQAIDPAHIKSANQVDKWANMIDAMSLGGRIRQLAIHATIEENSSDDVLKLSLDQSTKHLNSDAAHKQLEQAISEYLSRPITVELTIVEQTVHDPYQIQSTINDKRYDYAKSLLAEDDIIQTLQNDYQAKLDEATIKAL